jgi:hypothetical protein
MPFATTIAKVETAERYLGVHLPEEFRQRLVSVNGGELSTGGEDWRLFPVLDITNHSTADHGTTDIVSETRHARTLEGFPPKCRGHRVQSCGRPVDPAGFWLCQPTRSAGAALGPSHASMQASGAPLRR